MQRFASRPIRKAGRMFLAVVAGVRRSVCFHVGTVAHITHIILRQNRGVVHCAGVKNFVRKLKSQEFFPMKAMSQDRRSAASKSWRGTTVHRP